MLIPAAAVVAITSIGIWLGNRPELSQIITSARMQTKAVSAGEAKVPETLETGEVQAGADAPVEIDATPEEVARLVEEQRERAETVRIVDEQRREERALAAKRNGDLRRRKQSCHVPRPRPIRNSPDRGRGEECTTPAKTGYPAGVVCRYNAAQPESPRMLPRCLD